MKKMIKLAIGVCVLSASIYIAAGCASGHVENPDGSCCLLLGREGNTNVYSCTDGNDWWHGFEAIAE